MKLKRVLLITGTAGLMAVMGLKYGVWSYSSASAKNDVALRVAEPEGALIATKFCQGFCDEHSCSDRSCDRQTCNKFAWDKRVKCFKVTNNMSKPVEILVDFEKIDNGNDGSAAPVRVEANIPEDPLAVTISPGDSFDFPVRLTNGKPCPFKIKAVVTAKWVDGSAVIEDQSNRENKE